MGHPRKTWEYGKHVNPSSRQSEGSNSRSGLFRMFGFGNTSRTSFRDSDTRSNNAQDNFNSSASTTTYWPYDFVTRDFPDVRVLTYGYDSHPTHYYNRPTNQMTISQHSRKLLEQLTNNRVSCRGRPIIFVAHSLGGILVKEALIESLKFEENNDAHDLGMSCFAVVFFGTPHAGADIAEIGKRFAQAAECLTFRMNVDTRILDDLKRDSSHLELVNKDFIQTSRKRSYQIYCFQEGLPLSIFGGKGKKIVSDESSSFNNRTDERSCFIPADHRDMCRFKFQDTSPYTDFKGVFATYLNKIQGQSSKKTYKQLRESREALIQLLEFDGRLVREEQIRQLRTFETSFDWIWSSRFVIWLNDTKLPLFWISGKPASGKSTLMNYISRSRRPLSILDKASGQNWSRIYFFFDFKAGDGERNNFDGLARSLMVQLLREIPVLISHVLEFCQIDPVDLNREVSRTMLSPSLIRDALESGLRNLPTPLLILLDGLDEYEGDQLELVAFIKHSCSGTAKVCIACRPEPQLASAFEQFPSFTMQEVNRPGIKASILNKLTIQFGGSTSLNEDEILNLAEEITVKSEGVFLWATFAVNEIIQGISRGESMKSRALIHRLEQIPQELKDIYARIFESKSADTRKWAGFALLLICTAVGKVIPVSALQEALTWIPEINIGLSARENDIFHDTCAQNTEAFEKRLTDATGGVIEFYQGYPEGRARYTCSTVRLIHKSVETYLNSVGWSQLLGSDISSFYWHEIWIRICVRQWASQQSLIVQANELCNKYQQAFQLGDLKDNDVAEADKSRFPIDGALLEHCRHAYHGGGLQVSRTFSLLRYSLWYLPRHASLFEHHCSISSYNILRPAIMSHYAIWHKSYMRCLRQQILEDDHCHCHYEPFTLWESPEGYLHNVTLYRTLQMVISHRLGLFLNEFLAEGVQSYLQPNSNLSRGMLFPRLPWLSTWSIFRSKPTLNPEVLDILRKFSVFYATLSQDFYALVKQILTLAPCIGDDELSLAIIRGAKELIEILLSNGHFNYRKLRVHKIMYEKRGELTTSEYAMFTPLALVMFRYGGILATPADRYKILSMLLKFGADLDEECGPRGALVHHVIDSMWTESGSFKLLRYVIQAGASVNKEGPNGTPLDTIWERMLDGLEDAIRAHREYLVAIEFAFERFEQAIWYLVEYGGVNSRRDRVGVIPSQEQMLSYKASQQEMKKGPHDLLSRLLNHQKSSMDPELYKELEALLND